MGDPDPTSLEKPQLHSLQGGSKATEVTEKMGQGTHVLRAPLTVPSVFILAVERGGSEARKVNLFSGPLPRGLTV